MHLTGDDPKKESMIMPEIQGRERDFVLAPNEYVFIQDQTKGQVTVYVGPHKSTLAATDVPIVYDRRNRKVVQSDLLNAVQQFPTADEGYYLVLENPADDESRQHPRQGMDNALPKFKTGRKVNIPGPVTFPLWPGQVAQVIEGHRLRTNQYLVVRVYNDAEAKANLGSAVVQRAETVQPTGEAGGKQSDGQKPEGQPDSQKPSVDQAAPVVLTMGKLMVIKGVDVSFYIPPTGIEVVADENGQFVREAVTLERLEHCILLSEGGEKRYVRGPAVVFPEPTEQFLTDPKGRRKFRAIELNDDMGLYIKVTADYSEGGKDYKAGEELFVTGKQQRIYFPRAEHQLIKYGDKELHFGIAIPEGEARYVLDKLKGSIDLEKGPKIFLPDPRNQVITRRTLTDDQVALLYPGNTEAQQYNLRLRQIMQTQGFTADQPLDEKTIRAALGRESTRGTRSVVAEGAIEAFGGEAIDRGTAYTPPRTITLDTKYEGAVAINIWNGYAVLIADKAGNQRVEVGPKTILLEYDEYPVVMALSTGKPKNTDKLYRTAYLRVLYNHVTDIVEVLTGDDVKASVKVVWRVNFEGNPEKWFNVENYVKFLCDRTRSILRGVAKRLSIQELSEGYIPVIRDAILGAKPEGAERPGMRFNENGLHIYDVEISELVIGDAAIAQMLAGVQVESVKRAITLSKQAREYEDTLRGEELKRKTAEALVQTAEHAAGLEVRKTETAEEAKRKTAEAAAQSRVHAAKLALDDAVRAEETKRTTADASDKTAAELARLEGERITRETELAKAKHALVVLQLANRAALTKDEQALETDLVTARLARAKAERDQELTLEAADQKLKLEALEAETKAAVERFKAVSPEFTAALQNFGTRDIGTKLAEAVAPIALREGLSIGDALTRVFQGTPLESVVKSLAARYGAESRQ